jgi:predicted  nucleic acid-binding Zn-ribbon protein
LQALAEQFTRGFWGALVTTARDIQAPAAEDHRKLQDALDLHAKTALEAEALRSDLDAAYERIDSLAKTLQEAQQALEKRLEVQAEVIRSLHAGLQAREEELDKVLSAFQSMRGKGGERSPRRSLPEKL